MPEYYQDDEEDGYYYQLQLSKDYIFPYISVDSTGELAYTVTYLNNGVVCNDTYIFSTFEKLESSFNNIIIVWEMGNEI